MEPAEETRVWIVQILCPKRHCILATPLELPADADPWAVGAAAGNLLFTQLEEMIQKGTIHPWCGLCDAKRETFTAETGRTRFRTMEEAMPLLKAEAAKQASTREMIGAQKRMAENN
jgi:hypothetical protein